MLKIQLIIPFLFVTIAVLAQIESKPAIAFSNKPFEVGYDFIANLKNDRGVTLVFKQRIHQQEPKMWERQTAVRLLGSYNETVFIPYIYLQDQQKMMQPIILTAQYIPCCIY